MFVMKLRSAAWARRKAGMLPSEQSVRIGGSWDWTWKSNAVTFRTYSYRKNRPVTKMTQRSSQVSSRRTGERTSGPSQGKMVVKKMPKKCYFDANFVDSTYFRHLFPTAHFALGCLSLCAKDTSPLNAHGSMTALSAF